MSKFLDIALEHAARGLFVFPVAKDKSTRTAHGFKDATTDPDKIREWWAKMPAANPGLYPGASDVLVLDVDYGLTDMASFLAWMERNRLPRTYTVRSGSRPQFKVHLYFHGAMGDVGEWHLDGCSGQIKSLGGYVLAAGSEALHGEKHDRPGLPYEVIDGTLGNFAPTPDVIRHLRKPEKTATNNSQVPKSRWNLPVHAGENRTGFLMEQTGAMRNLGCGKDAILARMIELNEDPSVIADPVDHERLERTAENCAKLPLPEVAPIVELGRPSAPPEAAPLPERKRPDYPIAVWDGTAAGEFAKICASDNNIPRKFFVEAWLTILGAVVGDRLTCPARGGITRFFTFLILAAGKGKGTVISSAVQFWKASWASPLISVMPGFLQGAPDFMWKPKGVGARNASASSGPGMTRLTQERKGTSVQLTWQGTIPRIISIHEEAKTFLSSLFIEGGTGTNLDGVICQLWEGPEFAAPGTGTREALYGEMMFSMLCGITEEDWFDLLSKGDVVGGGLMSRLNIIGSLGEYDNVATIKPKDFQALQERFLPRIEKLIEEPRVIPLSEGASRVLADWHILLPKDLIRFNIRVLRLALLLSFLRQEDAISEKTMLDATLLGDYQIASHRYYTVTQVDNPLAAVQDKIFRCLAMKGEMKKGRLQDYTNARRVGTDLWNRALEGLVRAGRVGKREDATYYLAA